MNQATAEARKTPARTRRGKSTVTGLMAALLLMSATVAMPGCSDEPEEPSPDLAVIEGWIDTDKSPVVLFTSSMSPSGESEDLTEMMIRWGKVTISDGEQTLIMTGGRSDLYFPPYRYYTHSMKGKTGREYSITVDFMKLHATAKSKMPEPTPISEITMEPVAGNDSLVSATLWFEAPADVPAYYTLLIQELDKSSAPLHGMLGTAMATKAGERYGIPVLHAKQSYIFTDHFVAHPVRGERLLVTLARVDSITFEFWRSYDDIISFGNNPIVSPAADLPTNVSGGLGIFSARAISQSPLIIPD